MNSLSTYFGLLLLSVYCGVAVAQNEAKIRLGPEVLRAGEHGVGQLAVDATFRDLSGKELHVGQLAKNRRAVVFAMTSTSCPLSKKYFPSLIELAKTYESRGIGFVLVNPVATDDQQVMRRQQAALGTDAVYVFDPKGSLARVLGAITTTDVFVIDSKRTVIYHGAIDDQYGFGYVLDAPRKTFVVDALDAILDNRVPLIEATAAPGCNLTIEKSQATGQDSSPSLTYHGRISRLMQRRCVACHRGGGVAPFPLDTYKDVVSHSPMISEVVKRGIMPPWFAAPHEGGQASPWSNDCSLTKTEKQDLLGWIEGDQAKGDVSNAPKPTAFAAGWEIGKPDAVFQFETAVPVKATGIIPYKYRTIETELTEDKWVQAVEVQPGERSVVHHVLVFVRPPVGSRSEGDGIDYWAVYVPGHGAQAYREGYARRLPKGSRLVFQMHYTANGTATEDRTRIGLVFSDKPPKYEVKTASIVNTRFKIAPGADNQEVTASIQIPADVQILGFLPHHHLLGKATRYELLVPGRDPEWLLDVPRYDFNWQLFYKYSEPRIIKRGNSIRLKAWYDNSANNPANPDPTRTVGWGLQTEDEMHIGYIEYTLVGDKLGEEKGPDPRGVSFAALDTNRNGAISMTEIRKLAPNTPSKRRAEVFDRFDTDKNGTLDETEFKRLRKILVR